VPACRKPHGAAQSALATPEAYAREHLGVLPDAEQLAAWRRERLTKELEQHLAEHAMVELTTVARAPAAHRECLAPVPNPGTVEA
jgi:hypothetical protein